MNTPTTQSNFQHYTRFMNNIAQRSISLESPIANNTDAALHYFCSNSVGFAVSDNNISPLVQTTDPMSNCSSTSTNVSPMAVKSMKRKAKKGKKSRKKCGTIHSYDPLQCNRAQGMIQISKALTDNIIPQLIAEQIPYLYVYMDKSIALCTNDTFMNGTIRIMNFDFHCKKTNEMLYCVAKKQDDSKQSSRGYQWKMLERLFTANEIHNRYKIENCLPQSVRSSIAFTNQLCDSDKIKQVLCTKERQSMLMKARWCKIDIFTKVKNKKRMTLSITKPEFIKMCSDFMNNNANNIKLIPILMFKSNVNIHWVEHLWIVRVFVEERIDIGISFKYESDRENVIVSGVHLDKEYILKQHLLAVPQHSNNCHCLDTFQSNINDLRIGNPDDDKNRIKYYKQQIEELQNRLTQQSDLLGSLKDKTNVLWLDNYCVNNAHNSELMQMNRTPN